MITLLERQANVDTVNSIPKLLHFAKRLSFERSLKKVSEVLYIYISFNYFTSMFITFET